MGGLGKEGFSLGSQSDSIQSNENYSSSCDASLKGANLELAHLSVSQSCHSRRGCLIYDDIFSLCHPGIDQFRNNNNNQRTLRSDCREEDGATPSVVPGDPCRRPTLLGLGLGQAETSAKRRHRRGMGLRNKSPSSAKTFSTSTSTELYN